MTTKQITKPTKPKKEQKELEDTDNRMSKGQGYIMLALVLAGVVFVWRSLANIYLFGFGLVCLYTTYWLYNSHVKKGGKTISQALAENKQAKQTNNKRATNTNTNKN